MKNIRVCCFFPENFQFFLGEIFYIFEYACFRNVIGSSRNLQIGLTRIKSRTISEAGQIGSLILDILSFDC